MDVLNIEALEKFKKKHNQARKPLDIFESLLKNGQFSSYNDLKKTFGSADLARKCTIFDISGNKYRVIAKINYELEIVTIKYIFTHAEYDKWSAKNECC
jgi:mRNA interferase HigB